MRQKFINKVYMREILDHTWYCEKNEEFGGYIAIKYIKDIKKQIKGFANGYDYVGLDKGYTILEYVPENEKYNARVFFDRDNRPLIYYFDINNGNGEENGVPWYDDLYLDVILECPAANRLGYYLKLDDADELKQAFKEGTIDEVLFNQAHKTARKLMDELMQLNNDIFKRSTYDIVRLKEKIGEK